MAGRIIFWLAILGAIAFAIQGGEYSTLDLWRQRQTKLRLTAQADSLTRQVDSLVPAIVDLRPVADSLWRAFQQPLALDGASTAWLSMGVQGVSLAPVVGAGGAMRTAVVLSARPRVQLGAAPATRAQVIEGLIGPVRERPSVHPAVVRRPRAAAIVCTWKCTDSPEPSVGGNPPL